MFMIEVAARISQKKIDGAFVLRDRVLVCFVMESSTWQSMVYAKAHTPR